MQIGIKLAQWSAVALLALATLDARAEQGTSLYSVPTKAVERRPSSIRVGYESVNLPGNDAMGMVGTTYLIEVLPGISIGPAAYGAIDGKQGGFFTVGGELAWTQRLMDRVDLQAGLYLGAGGGGGGSDNGKSLWGGGMMLRPHADLLWDLDLFKAGASLSHVSFPDGGSVESTQLGLSLQMDTEFKSLSPELVGHNLSSSGRQGFGFDRITGTAGAYLPDAGSKKNDGSAPPSKMAFAGVRMEQFINPNLYWGFEAAGAASGGSAGYAEYLFLVGAETPLGDALSLGGRVSLGMGGGGGVSVGGGLLTKAAGYASYGLTDETQLSLEGGLVRAPDGNFQASFLTGGLTIDLDHPYAPGLHNQVVENEFVFGSAHYFSAAKKSGPAEGVDLLTIKLNRYLSETVYLTGQAHSAYLGNSGSYSEGLIGLGYRSSPLLQGLRLGAEMLVGAGGGGGVDTSGGAIVVPMGYLEYDLTRDLALKLGAGRVMSVSGPLSATVLDLGLSFDFGTNMR